MAKKSAVEKNKRRRRLVKKYSGKRERLQAVARDRSLPPEERFQAYLKLAEGRPYSALFESVEGGATIGRYSFITLKPDLVWRCFGDQAEINRQARAEASRFEPLEGEGGLKLLVEHTGYLANIEVFRAQTP